MLRPDLLHTHMPLQVAGEGNCLFRAISRAQYGTEDYHELLRLKTALELLTFSEHYDDTRADYVDIIDDRCLALPSYCETVITACTDGAYTELVHMYVASTVIGSPIESMHPSSSVHLAAWNKTIVGRAVSAQEVTVHIMWASSSVSVDSRHFSANHFVVLHPTANASATVQPTSAATVRQKRTTELAR